LMNNIVQQAQQYVDIFMMFFTKHSLLFLFLLKHYSIIVFFSSQNENNNSVKILCFTFCSDFLLRICGLNILKSVLKWI